MDAADGRRLRTTLVHLGVWAAFAALVVVTEGGRAAPRAMSARLAYALSLVLLTAPPVYAHFALFDRYFLRGRYVAHVGLLAAVVLAWAVIFDMASALLSGPIVGQYAALVPTILLVVLFSTGIRMLGLVGRQHAQIQEMRARNLQAELDLLKAQVHPHFLFNTLNNLFGLARQGAPAAADGIAQLSHLLRYLIHESRAERVELAKEADQNPPTCRTREAAFLRRRRHRGDRGGGCGRSRRPHRANAAAAAGRERVQARHSTQRAVVRPGRSDGRCR